MSVFTYSVTPNKYISKDDPCHKHDNYFELKQCDQQQALTIATDLTNLKFKASLNCFQYYYTPAHAFLNIHYVIH